MSESVEHVPNFLDEDQTPSLGLTKEPELEKVRKAGSLSRIRGAEGSIVTPENILLRLKRLPSPKQSSNLSIHTSTHRGSPNKVSVVQEDKDNSFTPINKSALPVSMPQPLIESSGEMNASSLQENLNIAADHARILKDLSIRMKAAENVTSTISQLEEQFKTIDPNINKRITDLESKYNKFSQAVNLIESLSTRMSTIESSIKLLKDSFKTQSVTCNISAECQKNLTQDYSSFQHSTRNDIDCLSKILDLITTKFKSCLQNNLPSQPEVSAVDKPSLDTNEDVHKVNSWWHYHHPDTNQFEPTNTSNQLNHQSALDLQPPRINRNREESIYDENKSNVTSSSTLDIYSRSLKRQMKALGKLMFPEPVDSIDKATLNDMYHNRLPLIDSERRDLQKSLREYLKISQANIALCDDVEDNLDSADLWATKVREIYLNKGHHKKSQTKALYETLPKFGQQSEIDIFEFTRRFENLTTEFEIPEERAELFYSKYLSPSLQDEVVKVKEHYDKMKELLLIRYGDLDTITANILVAVRKEKLPARNADLGMKLTYYRKLQSAFQKIDKLVGIPDVPTKEVEDYIFSHQFLKHLNQLLPEPVLESFVDAMRNLGQNITKIRGKIAFKTMLNCTNHIYEKIDSMARNTDFFLNDKSRIMKDKSAKCSSVTQTNHAHISDDSSSSDNDTDSKQRFKVHFQNKDGSFVKQQKPVSSKKFPCISSDHDHNLSECGEFFSMSPADRLKEGNRSLLSIALSVFSQIKTVDLDIVLMFNICLVC